MIDSAAIAAAWDIAKRLGPDAARELLAMLELPDEARWAVGKSLFQQESTLPVGEMVADIEQDTTGKTLERLIAGLHATLD